MNLPSTLSSNVMDHGSHLIDQVHYSHLDGALVCDDVLYFEELPKCFNRIKRKVGLTASLLWRNKSNIVDWNVRPPHQYYSREMIDVMHQLYARDFDVLGYSDNPKRLAPPSRLSMLWNGRPPKTIAIDKSTTP